MIDSSATSLTCLIQPHHAQKEPEEPGERSSIQTLQASSGSPSATKIVTVKPLSLLQILLLFLALTTSAVAAPIKQHSNNDPDGNLSQPGSLIIPVLRFAISSAGYAAIYALLRRYSTDSPSKVYGVASLAGVIAAVTATDPRVSSEVLFTTLAMACVLLGRYYRSLFPDDVLNPKRLTIVVAVTLGTATLICQLISNDSGPSGGIFIQLLFISAWLAINLIFFLPAVHGS